MTQRVKALPREDVFKPAAAIVKSVMSEEVTDNDVCQPKPSLLIRIANRYRQALRPQDPTTLEFDVSTSFFSI